MPFISADVGRCTVASFLVISLNAAWLVVIHDLKKADPVFFLRISYFSLIVCFRFTKIGFVEWSAGFAEVALASSKLMPKSPEFR